MNQHHPDGAWMCSAHGMDDEPAPKRAPFPFWPIALCFGIPFLLALAIAWRHL